MFIEKHIRLLKSISPRTATPSHAGTMRKPAIPRRVLFIEKHMRVLFIEKHMRVLFIEKHIPSHGNSLARELGTVTYTCHSPALTRRLLSLLCEYDAVATVL